MKVYCIPVGMLQTNCYILACEETKKAIIVDPGDEGAKIDSLLKSEGLDPVLVVNTHAHYDHIGANRYFHEKGVPIAIHKLDSKLMMAGGGAEILGSRSMPNPAPDRYLEEGDTIEFGNQKLSVIFTPGHSPGSISLYSKKDNLLFCGDALSAAASGAPTCLAATTIHLCTACAISFPSCRARHRCSQGMVPIPISRERTSSIPGL